jgi:hypothetical protein
MAHALEFIMDKIKFPDGFDTLVGERVSYLFIF